MKVHDGVSGRLREFVEAQPVFFVATAPAGADGHVNVSPKGMRGTFLVRGDHEVAYLDYHGSGSETIAHLRENGRITLMFCAFTGAPNIVRLHGRGTFTPVTDAACAALVGRVPGPAGPPRRPRRRHRPRHPGQRLVRLLGAAHDVRRRPRPPGPRPRAA